MTKVLAINASPRKYGNTYKLLKVALEAVNHEGLETELIHLYDYELKPCMGCVSDDINLCRPPCLMEDDAWEVLRKIRDSDGLIIATPIYWYGPPGHLKTLIDKMTVFENMSVIEGRSWIEGKAAGFIAAGGDSGEIMTIAYLMVVLNSMGLVIPPWALAYYTGLGDALDADDKVLDAANVGLAVAKAVKSRLPKEWYDPHLTERLGGIELLNRIRREASSWKKRQSPEREYLFKRMKSADSNKYRSG